MGTENTTNVPTGSPSAFQFVTIHFTDEDITVSRSVA
jgi:hypothetical protein